MRVRRDQATRPCRRLTPAAPPVRPAPPPAQLLVREAISARSEHRSCPERTFVCAGYAPVFAAPHHLLRSALGSAWRRLRRPPRRHADRRSFQRRPRPSGTRPGPFTSQQPPAGVAGHSAPCHADHHPVDVCTRARRRQGVSVRRKTPTIDARAPPALGHLRIGKRMTPD